MTKEFIATVLFSKDVEKDNYEIGCYGGIHGVMEDTITIEFNNKEDLLNQLASWTASHFDVTEENFLKHTENECEKNRFDYAQGEDEEGNYTMVTEDNPEGYYAMYFYKVKNVSKKVAFSF
ncbi:hypothetical protein [Phage f2b1]|nr:hypothetical protein [Phage f2b1]